ncbi:FAD-dependent oxidoreductase [Tateyamaria sp.]|uniref:FAD-dependent oxidoreductase n=1 Tax=Tateyamaria sp. TaxID=1929288 RepID=UPI00329D73C7
MKIAIAGAGIGGLATAILLRQNGAEVTLFDQFLAPEPVGSGLVIQPVGQAVLKVCGVLDETIATGNLVHRMLGHEGDSGRRVLDVWYDRANGQRKGLALHRNALFQALWDSAIASGTKVRTGAEVTQAHAGVLTLADGTTTEPFDLIVDALGAHSPLSPMSAKDLPYGALWANVDWPETSELPKDELRQTYRKASNMVGVLPIGTPPGQDKPMAAIFWSLPQGRYDAWRKGGLAVWQDQAATLWPAFADFAAQITDPDQLTMARYAHGTLATPYADRITHIGDAAHRASPQLGQGANMALLDAYALARALKAHPVAQALPAYAKARRWHVRTYQAMSWAFTPQYQSDSRWLPVLRDRLLFPASMIPPVPRLLTSLVCGTVLPAFPRGDPLR